jgi:hypothetical protein
VADKAFADAEQAELNKAKFIAKEREQFTAETPLKFNGGLIYLIADGITFIQERQCKNLSTISTKAAISTGFRGTIRTLIPKDQYVA